VVVQRTLRREAVLGWFAQRRPCLVGMEACASAHWFARELTALGHSARIIAPEFVRPFRLSGKNDAHDARAICAAVRQPQLRFVTVKSAEQQARLVVHRLRQGWQEERTAGINRLRGLLAEFGQVYRNSAPAALAGAREALADETLPAALRRAVARLLEHLRALDQQIVACDAEIVQDVDEDARARRLLRLSDVGVLTASAVAATVADPAQFRCGRQFAAWIGLTPRQHSTGGTLRFGPHHAPWRHLPARATRARGALGVASGTTRGSAAAQPSRHLDRAHLRAHRLPQDTDRHRQQTRAVAMGVANARPAAARARRLRR
jgi:transposase